MLTPDDIGALSAVLVALVLLITAVVVESIGISIGTARRRAAMAMVPPLAGAGVGRPVPAENVKAVPLTWNPSGEIYDVTFSVGNSTVSAVLDSGSSRFIVSTNSCSSCSSSTYDPTASPTSIAIADPRGSAVRNVAEPIDPTDVGNNNVQVLCTDTVSYVSQTNSIQMYSDTVRMPRIVVSTQTLCTDANIDGVVSSAKNTQPLVIRDFPIGGITSSQGTSVPQNVFGMSGNLSITKYNGEYLLPSCQLTPNPSYEAATIQAIAMYYNSINRPTIWSIQLGIESGIMVFGPIPSPCVSVQYVPMQRSLVNANNDLDASPWRFYVVQVQSIVVGGQQMGDIPSYFILDTGSTQVSIPGPQGQQIADAITGISGDQTVVFTFGDGTPGNTATLTYTSDDTTFNSDAGIQTVFTGMPDTTAQYFSTKLDTGLFGVTAMRNRYLEFNLTTRRVGFAKV